METVHKSSDILMVDGSSGIGGAGLSLESLVASSPDLQYAYRVVLPGPGPFAHRLKEEAVSVEFVSVESWRWWVDTPTKALKFLLTLPLQIASLVRWVRFLRRKRPDLIHFNSNRLIEPVVAARVLDIPSVMHFRDIPSRLRYRFALGRRVFYQVMNLSDLWIANSCATARDIQPYALRPVRTIPNGLDLIAFDRMANASDDAHHMSDMSGGSLKVAMIALLTPWKNVEAFVHLAHLLSSGRSDVIFFVAGSGDPRYKSQLKELAERLGVTTKVTFLGHVDNIPRLLSKMDLLVHTTDREPFGRVFIEAMAACRPVVAFNSGGAAEIVVDGETGVLVPPDNLERMAQAIRGLLNDSVLRRQMGAAGRRRVEQHYTLVEHRRAVAAVYRELVEMRSKRSGTKTIGQDATRS